MNVTLLSIRPLSIAKTFAIGVGILSAVVCVPSGLVVSLSSQSLNGVIAIVMTISMAMVAGFIGGFIIGSLYNIVSPSIGGLELEVEGISNRPKSSKAEKTALYEAAKKPVLRKKRTSRVLSKKNK
jgi:hypothetical protein